MTHVLCPVFCVLLSCVYTGLVDLTTTSNPSPGAADPDTVPEKRIASSNSTAMSLGLGPFGFLRTRQRNPDDWRRLLMEQRRIERLQVCVCECVCVCVCVRTCCLNSTKYPASVQAAHAGLLIIHARCHKALACILLCCMCSVYRLST